MTEIDQELAALRCLWGGAYRITWNGQFHATHLASSEMLEATSPNELRMLLLADHDQRASEHPMHRDEAKGRNS
jgi:hypothetical protein